MEQKRRSQAGTEKGRVREKEDWGGLWKWRVSGDGIRPKLHLLLLQFLSHTHIQIQLQVLLALGVGWPQRHTFPVRVPGSEGRGGGELSTPQTPGCGESPHQGSAHLPGPSKVGPVPHHLPAQQFLLLGGSFWRRQSQNPALTRICQKPKVLRACWISFTPPFPPGSSHWPTAQSSIVGLILCLHILRPRAARVRPRDPGFQMEEADHTASLSNQCSSRNSHEAAGFLGSEATSLSLLLPLPLKQLINYGISLFEKVIRAQRTNPKCRQGI